MLVLLVNKFLKGVTKQMIRTRFGEIPRDKYEGCQTGPGPKLLIVAESINS